MRLLKLTMFFSTIGVAISIGDGQTVDQKRSQEQIRKTWIASGWKFQPGWDAVTEEKLVQAWGKRLQTAISERDNRSIEKNLVDFDAMVDFLASGIPNRSFADGFRRGVRTNIANVLEKIGVEDSSYRFQKVLQTEYGPAALMRFVGPDMNTNYHLWRLQKNESGQAIGLDMYIFASGESFCEMMKRIGILSAPKQGNRSFFDRLIGRELQLARNQEAIIGVLQSSQRQDHKQTLERYWKLPEELQKEKFLLLTRLKASQQTGDDEYKRTLEDFRRFHPNDASADLLMLDLHFLNGDFDKYFAGLKRLEKVVGPDAHLMLLRHGALSELKKFDEGEEALKKGQQLEPDYENVHWTLVAHYVGQKKIPAAVKVLRLLADKFGYVEFDYEGVPGFEELQKSKLLKELNDELAEEIESETEDGLDNRDR